MQNKVQGLPARKKCLCVCMCVCVVLQIFTNIYKLAGNGKCKTSCGLHDLGGAC